MTERLEKLSILPNGPALSSVNSDLLSHVLAQLRLTGDGIASATAAPGEAFHLVSDAGHVCIVTDGAVVTEGGEGQPEVVASGDLVLFPNSAGGFRLFAHEAAATMVICRFRFDLESLRGMVVALPSYIHIGKDEGEGWLDGVLHFLMIEANDIQPGAGLMISRLIDLAVIRTLRTWVQRGQTLGWVGGLADERVARALKAMHEAPMQRLSIDALANIAGMSRSSFCERFAVLVGRSPLRYQNEWRLRAARDLLLRRQARVGEIGLSVGYESEAAFSRAYKALFGHSPRTDYQAHGPSP